MQCTSAHNSGPSTWSHLILWASEVQSYQTVAGGQGHQWLTPQASCVPVSSCPWHYVQEPQLPAVSPYRWRRGSPPHNSPAGTGSIQTAMAVSPEGAESGFCQEEREFRYLDPCGWQGWNRTSLPASWNLQNYSKWGCDPQVMQNLPSNVH